MKSNLRQSEIFEAIFTYRKVQELRDFLNKNPNINFMAINDGQGNNVLHQLAYEGHLDLIKIFIHQTKKNSYNKQSEASTEHLSFDQQFKDWLNKKNNQGFTPFLYAAYSGNMEVIKYFVEEHKVNDQAKTSNGLNALHLASQKNMVLPFLYFKDRISLQDIDNMNSTPLHWAAYMNSEEVVSYILSVSNIDFINKRDTQGNTPLMLAVTYGNTRVVRRLLIKGANRYIRNNEGKLPIQVAQESEFKTITKMLDENFSCCDFVKFYCNIKIEYKPKGRKYIIPLLFLVGFILNVGIINIFLQFKHQAYLYTEILVFALMIIFYFSLLLPLPQHQKREFSELLAEYNQKKIKKACFQCINLVPRRGYHCDICGVCVKQYDHHCTWINNCVGKKNIGRFIIFLTFLLLSLGIIAFLSVLSTICILSQDSEKFSSYFILRYDFTDNLQKYCLVALFLVCEITSVFFFPVLTLFVVQIKNLLTNKTTFEKARGTVQDSQIKNLLKSNKPSLRNCRVMCTDLRASYLSNRSSFAETTTANKRSNDLITQDHAISQAADSNQSIH